MAEKDFEALLKEAAQRAREALRSGAAYVPQPKIPAGPEAKRIVDSVVFKKEYMARFPWRHPGAEEALAMFAREFYRRRISAQLSIEFSFTRNAPMYKVIAVRMHNRETLSNKRIWCGTAIDSGEIFDRMVEDFAIETAERFRAYEYDTYDARPIYRHGDFIVKTRP